MRANMKKTFRPVKLRIPRKHASAALWKSINKSFIFENKSFNYKNKSFGLKNKSFILSFTPMRKHSFRKNEK